MTRCALALVLAIGVALPAEAWGPIGHRVVGELAVRHMGDPAREELRHLLGDLSPDTIAHACYWPDQVRRDPLWRQSGPLHYVNLPRGTIHYFPRRDCPDGRCVVASIEDHAAILGNPALPLEYRAVAFAWVCHLVADLHQPMHTGYADDRGGNEFTISYAGEYASLHWFWDELVLTGNGDDAEALLRQIGDELRSPPEGAWTPMDIRLWLIQSRSVLENSGYPESPRISPEFEERSRDIAHIQLRNAAEGLAKLLRTVLKPADSQIEDDSGTRRNVEVTGDAKADPGAMGDRGGRDAESAANLVRRGGPVAAADHP